MARFIEVSKREFFKKFEFFDKCSSFLLQVVKQGCDDFTINTNSKNDKQYNNHSLKSWFELNASFFDEVKKNKESLRITDSIDDHLWNNISEDSATLYRTISIKNMSTVNGSTMDYTMGIYATYEFPHSRKYLPDLQNNISPSVLSVCFTIEKIKSVYNSDDDAYNRYLFNDDKFLLLEDKKFLGFLHKFDEIRKEASKLK